MYHSHGQPNHARFQPHDSYAMLQEALRLPSQLSAVADWLFGEHGRDFHVTECKLAPEAFNYCSVLMSKSEILGGPNGQSDHSAAASGPDSSNDDKASLLMLQIPTKEYQGIFLGYTFTIGVPFDESLFPIRDALSDTFCLVGRFAFDVENKYLLIYLANLSANTSVLMELSWINPNHRRRSYFSIPTEEYSYCNLPKEVLGVTVNDEMLEDGTAAQVDVMELCDVYANSSRSNSSDMRSATPPPASEKKPYQQPPSEDSMILEAPNTFVNQPDLSTSLSYDDDVTSLHPHLFPEWEEMDTGSSMSNGGAFFEDRNPFESAQNSMQLVEVVPREQHQDPSDTNSNRGALLLPPSALSSFLNGMAGVFTGRFFSPGVIREIKAPRSAPGKALVAGRVEAFIRLGNDNERSLLSEFAARAYYEGTMAASNDRYFICLEGPQEKEANESEKQWTPARSPRDSPSWGLLGSPSGSSSWPLTGSSRGSP